MEDRHRKKSKISQLVVPIVTSMARKLSRNEKSDVSEEFDIEKSDESENLPMDYPLDFVSQMKEVFKEFDKVFIYNLTK